ncbi:MAG: type IV pilin, partial [Methanobacteriota archaeon]
MIKLMRNHKKSVSPVIAVVLLIALTVAAGAIIWTIV